ncbi:MAG: amidohydrolase family protein, partial [Eubacteriales bacterium]|nr:amidohydrolase family protein [Eubacteriales bacterium]
MFDLWIENGKVFLEGAFTAASVGVKDGKIAVIAAPDVKEEARETLDLGGQYLIPGAIDTHMHVRDPGHTERGNFYTETLAAAAGGVTTIMEHPISVPPQYNVEILENRIERAEAQCVVDFCFYGAAGGEHPEEITRLADDGRIVAYKTFLHKAPNGREQEFKGLTMADDGELMVGMQELAKTGLICAFHAEDNDLIQYYIDKFQAEGRVSYQYHALSRPVIAEVQSVERVLRFARETGARIEIAHVSTPQAMELLKKAKREGLDVYAETCPHYLFLNEADLEKYGPFAKCNPPVRTKELSDRLWDYVNDGTVDY